MSKKKNKDKKSSLNKIQKKVKKYAPDIIKSNLLLGFAGGALVSSFIFAGIRSDMYRSLLKSLKK
jgi:hypothetical protein